ncbi:UBC12 enzyme, partial [Chloropsis hardwickii]|nr:UBC12 enzyme [Chloropsis hardwickii]
MIKLFSLKQQKKEEESAGGTKSSSKKASAAQLRIQKGLRGGGGHGTGRAGPSWAKRAANWGHPSRWPWGGRGRGGRSVATGADVVAPQVGQGYPHDPPKVKCETMVYHPNIDLEGNVCLNILR